MKKSKKRDEVLDERLTLLNAREAAQYLRVSLFTLSRIEREGGIVPFRTPGGHRRYSLRMLHEYLEKSRRCAECLVTSLFQRTSAAWPIPMAPSLLDTGKLSPNLTSLLS